ncbi:flagellar biosynthesis anti-sigma factor FlgM [bacterium]|nr:flagellar biosynthesis anti-sigma factor FlgM [bacterium]
MEISRDLGVRATPITRSSESTDSPAQNSSASSAGGSTLRVSDSAKQLNDLARLVKESGEYSGELEDARSARVEMVKHAIESRSYKVDLDQLASRLVEEDFNQ